MVHSAISITLDPITTPGNGEISTCPAQEEVNAAIQTLRASIRMIAQNNPNCGSGVWYRVAYLNVSDSSQQQQLNWGASHAPQLRHYNCYVSVNLYLGQTHMHAGSSWHFLQAFVNFLHLGCEDIKITDRAYSKRHKTLERPKVKGRNRVKANTVRCFSKINLKISKWV
jgi:hypothetical protein